MPENNQILSVEGQLCGIPLAGPESFSAEQLAYLKRALGVDETVLWENSGTTAATSMTLSEDVRNFERFRVYWLWNNGTDFVSRADEFSNFYTGTTHRVFDLDGIYRYGGTTFTVYSRFVLDTSYSSITYEYSNQNNDTAKYIVVNKIVGIHRIAGGN